LNWNIKQWEYFDLIIQKESSWDNTAQNPTSSAYGYCQRMMSLHTEDSEAYRSNPNEQIRWCITYIQKRYGTPEQAWKFHKINNYY